MFVLLERLQGVVQKVWVTDDEELIEQWQREVDALHDIVRDDEGEAEDSEWEVTVHDVDQYQITMTVDNIISLN